MTIAEESTAVADGDDADVSVGGLGFGYKWNMGWMHDTLQYHRARSACYRRYHLRRDLVRLGLRVQRELHPAALARRSRARQRFAAGERCPATGWQRFANLRLLFGHMYAHPGKKLLFMGGEFAQCDEWNHDARSIGTLDDAAARRHAAPGRDCNRLLPRNAGALRARRGAARLRVDRLSTMRSNCVLRLCAPRAAASRRASRSATLRPSCANGYRIGVPRAGDVSRSAQHRRRPLRRRQRRQLGGVVTEPMPFARPRATRFSSRCRRWRR